MSNLFKFLIQQPNINPATRTLITNSCIYSGAILGGYIGYTSGKTGRNNVQLDSIGGLFGIFGGTFAGMLLGETIPICLPITFPLLFTGIATAEFIRRRKLRQSLERERERERYMANRRFT